MINRDYDDVRRFADAASAGVKKALAVGARAPVVAVFATKEFRQATLVSLLAALETTYVVNKANLALRTVLLRKSGRFPR